VVLVVEGAAVVVVVNELSGAETAEVGVCECCAKGCEVGCEDVIVYGRPRWMVVVTVGPWTVVVVVVVVVELLLFELGPAGESGMEGKGSVLLLLTALMRLEPGRDDDMACSTVGNFTSAWELLDHGIRLRGFTPRRAASLGGAPVARVGIRGHRSIRNQSWRDEESKTRHLQTSATSGLTQTRTGSKRTKTLSELKGNSSRRHGPLGSGQLIAGSELFAGLVASGWRVFPLAAPSTPTGHSIRGCDPLVAAAANDSRAPLLLSDVELAA
jgi:hypothetical protein